MTAKDELKILLTAEVKSFTQNMSKAEKSQNKVTKGSGKLGKALGGLVKGVAAAAAVAVAAITAVVVIVKKLTKEYIEYANKMDKASKSTGVATEELQKLAYVAEQEHGSFEKLEKALGKINTTVVEAADGVATYADIYKDMGIDVKNSSGELKTADEIFMEVGDYVKNAADETEALGKVNKLLGAGVAKDLIPMLKMSREEYERLGDEAQNLGIVLSGEAIKAAKAFDDKILSLKTRFKGMKMDLAGKLLPSLETLLEAFNENSDGIEGFVDSIVSLASVIASLLSNQAGGFLKFLSDLLWGFEQAAKGAQVLADVMDKLSGGEGRKGREAGEADARLKRFYREVESEEALYKMKAENYAMIREQDAWLRQHPGATGGSVKDAERNIALAKRRNELIDDEFERRKKLKTVTPDITVGGVTGKTTKPPTEYALALIELEDERLRQRREAVDLELELAGVGSSAKLEELQWLLTLTSTAEEKAEVEKAILIEKENILASHAKNQAIRDEDENQRKEKELEKLKEAFNYTQHILDTLESAFDSFRSSVQRAFGTLIDDLLEPLKIKIDESATAFEKFGATVVNSMTDMVAKVLIQGVLFAGFIALLNLIPPPGVIGTAFAKLVAGGALTGEGGFFDDIKKKKGMKIPGLASGGPTLAGQDYIVGEEGPEIFSPNTSGHIFNTSVLDKLTNFVDNIAPMTAGAGALTVKVNVAAQGALSGWTNFIVNSNQDEKRGMIRVIQEEIDNEDAF